MKQKKYTLQNYLYFVGRTLSRAYGWLLFEKKVHQEKDLPKGAKIFAFNHPSTFDPFFAMGVIKKPVHAILANSVFNVFALGKIVKLAGHVHIDDNDRKKAVTDAVELLQKGRSVLIFPEGAISPDPTHVANLHTGAVRIALRSRRPIVPIGVYLDPTKVRKKIFFINNKVELVSWYRYGAYVVSFGKPLYLKGRASDRQCVANQSKLLRERIKNQVHQSQLIHQEITKEWQARKAKIEAKWANISKRPLLPSFSPKLVQPIMAILTVVNNLVEILINKP
ncbi:1-acyl-sn-glycerol-3-phosphate acyltransferase [Patescibacteria group bacterium]|nr:1-acyl-sn-glycerol-3-phosphate acyltransferase [Patescibacteria group bacterium]